MMLLMMMTTMMTMTMMTPTTVAKNTYNDYHNDFIQKEQHPNRFTNNINSCNYIGTVIVIVAMKIIIATAGYHEVVVTIILYNDDGDTNPSHPHRQPAALENRGLCQEFQAHLPIAEPSRLLNQPEFQVGGC